MKVYISGKMKGLDKEDYEQNFDDAEKALKMQGHEVINPCKSIWNGDDHSHEGKKWGEMIRKDLELLSGCDCNLHAQQLERGFAGLPGGISFCERIGNKDP
jgi:hypothetical protein